MDVIRNLAIHFFCHVQPYNDSMINRPRRMNMQLTPFRKRNVAFRGFQILHSQKQNEH